MLATLDDTALDGGPRKGAATERFCVVEREVRPVEELIRFVVGPDGAVVPDLKRNLPGRGLWVTATHQAVDQAFRRKLFAKGFKRDVRTERGSRPRPSTICWNGRRSMRSRSPARPARS